MIEFRTKFTELYTTPVWQTQITGVDNTQIKEYCLGLRKKYPGIKISNRGGWHSQELDTPLPDALDELLHDLTEYINRFAGQYTKATDLILGNWWININGKGDYNTEHDHQNALLSAVYYVEVLADDTGDLVIHRDDHSRFYLGKYKKDMTDFSSQAFIIPPNTGKLVIFPAWTKHSVEQNKSNTERISIAFNFVEPK
jgi:uncharacterized protein (TIGR02466 family)